VANQPFKSLAPIVSQSWFSPESPDFDHIAQVNRFFIRTSLFTLHGANMTPIGHLRASFKSGESRVCQEPGRQ
jgi:hypothetical protein